MFLKLKQQCEDPRILGNQAKTLDPLNYTRSPKAKEQVLLGVMLH